VAVGSVLVWSGSPPGEALAWYVIMYDLERFYMEFLRGDADRPYHGGFSEAQWISVALTFIVVVGGLAGVLPFRPLHVEVASILVLTMLVVALRRRAEKNPPRHKLLHPQHIREVAHALTLIAPEISMVGVSVTGGMAEMGNIQPSVQIHSTSLGINISAGASAPSDAGRRAHHFTISSRDGPMTEEAAMELARLLAWLRPSPGTWRLVRGSGAAFHLLMEA
jgi:hypothetical protein